MFNDKEIRRAIVKRDMWWFFYFFFSHYVEYEAAPFHQEFFEFAMDESIGNVGIAAFRGSGKSAIFSLAFPLWLISGTQQKKHIVIVSQTQEKAQRFLSHIKNECETNELLKADMGPLKVEYSEWNANSIVFKKYGARITVMSVEQSLRGIRHNQHRPDVVVLDDIETSESVKTLEGRNKLLNWIASDVIPAGHKRTRLFFLGSILHRDGIMKRVERMMTSGQMKGVYREYPIVDENNRPTWPGKFPDIAAVLAEKARGITDAAWMSEYLLKPPPDDRSIIPIEFIHFYDELPEEGFQYAVTGTDIAVSKSDTADFTSMVSGHVYGMGKDKKIYIRPHPVNARLDPTESLERAKELSLLLGNGRATKMYAELAAGQAWFPDILKQRGIPVVGVPVKDLGNKLDRLSAIAAFIKEGKILFPRHGAEELICQIVDFGSEDHDDLCDALTILCIKEFLRPDSTAENFIANLKGMIGVERELPKRNLNSWVAMASQGRFWN